jgi:hypothetical protein
MSIRLKEILSLHAPMKKYHSTWPANKTWLIKGSKVHNALKEVVLDKRNIMRFNNVRLKDQYDEGYSRNALCALNLIFTFYYDYANYQLHVWKYFNINIFY